MTIAVHPLAALIPAMAEDQFAELRADIEAHGLIEPIVLHEHMVLDGRHRLRACEEIGLQPRFTEFEGESPAEFVLSINVKRRHLTPSQRAAIAAEFLPRLEEEARKRQQVAGQAYGRGMDSSGSQEPKLSAHRAREEAGALAGVSGASVDRAKRVKRQDPEMYEQVKAGTLTVREADNVLRERGRENGTSPSPLRGSRWGRKPDEKLGHFVTAVRALVPALEEMDVTAAAETADEATRDAWRKQLTTTIQALSRLRRQLNG